MEEKKKHKEKCHYHLCDYVGHLKRCPYCNQDFCENHYYPIEPHVGFEEYGLHKLDPKDTHPCPGWQEYEEEQNKNIWKKWGETLDILSGKKKEYSVKFDTLDNDEKEKIEGYKKEENKTKIQKDKKHVKLIIKSFFTTIISLIFLIIVSLLYILFAAIIPINTPLVINNIFYLFFTIKGIIKIAIIIFILFIIKYEIDT